MQKPVLYKRPVFYIIVSLVVLLVLMIIPTTFKDRLVKHGEEVGNTGVVDNNSNNRTQNNIGISSNNQRESNLNDDNTGLEDVDTTNSGILRVSAYQIQTQPYTITENVLGFVYSGSVNNVVAEMPGFVNSLSVQEGDRVHKGDVLAVIESQDLYNNRRSVLADINSMKAQIELQDLTVNRITELVENGFSSQADLDAANLQLTSYKNKLISLQSSLKNINRDISKLTIKSPQSGFVQKKEVNNGDFIGSGSLIVQIIDDVDLKIRAGIPLDRANDIVVGKNVKVTYLATGQNFDAHVSSIKPELDESTRTIQVIIDIDSSNFNLRPASVVSLDIEINKVDDAILIPEESVVLRPQGSVVYVVPSIKEDTVQHVKAVAVEVMELNDGSGMLMEVSDALSPGDIIVRQGAGFLTDQAMIRLGK